jgi:hypothetical protein
VRRHSGDFYKKNERKAKYALKAKFQICPLIGSRHQKSVSHHHHVDGRRLTTTKPLPDSAPGAV